MWDGEKPSLVRRMKQPLEVLVRCGTPEGFKTFALRVARQGLLRPGWTRRNLDVVASTFVLQLWRTCAGLQARTYTTPRA